MIPTDEIAWFCLRTSPKQENLAAAHLRAMEGVEVFSPRIRIRKATRRGPVWFVEALFPCYLFAKFDRMLLQKAVTYAPGVSTIVHFGETLARIPEQAIIELRTQIGDTECKVIETEIRQGDNVTVTHGLFTGLTTVVTQLMPAKDRVRILMNFLGEQREVELAREHVIPERAHFLSTSGNA